MFSVIFRIKIKPILIIYIFFPFFPLSFPFPTPQNKKMDFLDENIQHGIKKGLRSMTHILYNELYVYVWFICIYHVILVILLLTNLILLIKIYSHRTPQFPLSLFSTATFPSITQEIPLSELELLKESFVKLAQQQV